jgi:flavin-dependent thymidylate synthase
MTETSKDVQKWADAAMFEGEPHPWDEKAGVLPKVYLVHMTSDPLGCIAAQSEMYKGRVVRSLDDLTDDQRRKAFEDIQATHLDGPLETIDMQFMVEGVDRAFTHQMVRERLASYAQESQRFAVIDDLEHAVTLPPSLMGTRETDGVVDVNFPDMDRQQRWRTRYDRAIKVIREEYQALVADGMPQEDARGLLPHATATRLSYKTNLRSLQHHAGNRLCTQAQFHWRYVYNQIVDAIGNYPVHHYIHPGTEWQYEAIATSNIFRPVCYRLGHCPFKASFDRPCKIRDRVDKGEFDKIDFREWAFDPTAARVAG